MSNLLPLEDVDSRIFFLVRFDKRKYLESFIQGNLYMHNTSWHNELEEKKNVKGQGDKDDGKFVLSDIKFQMYDIDTNKLTATGKAKQSSLYHSKSPIFCLFTVTKYNIIEKKIDIENKKILLRYAFTKEQHEYIRESYKNADSALIILNPQELISQIKEYATKHELDTVCKTVKYSDFKINYQDRINDYVRDFNNIYFWKDNYFRLEQEFRILFPSLEIDENITLPIGEIKNTQIYDIDKLFDMRIDLIFDLIDI